MNRRKRYLGTALALCTLTSLTVGCGTQGSNTASSGNSTATNGSTASSALKVGLVTDTGGLNDHGFNHLADVGLENAKSKFGIQGDVVQSKAPSDYIPNLTNFARQGDNLVIAVGYLMHDAVEQVAKQYPNTKFLIIDDVITDRKNVTCAIFKTEQCGYLAGVLAGELQQKKGIKGINTQNTVGVVGGMKIPPVDSYIAGFQQGVRAVSPSTKVIVKYAGNFDDQALGSQFAQSEISQGADIVFQVAGGTGVGVIQAAKKAGVYAIGVDADQHYLAPGTVLTSATKGVDIATYSVIEQLQNKKFTAGVQNFQLSNNGAGLAEFNSVVPQDIQNDVKKYAEKIKNGSINVSATVK